MTIYYVDLVSGDDSTGTGSSSAPWRTGNKANTSCANGDEIRFAKTADDTPITSANCTFTRGSVIVNTSVSLVGTLNIGDYIGKTGAVGDGSAETYYRVLSVSSGSVTLEARYYGTTETVGTIHKLNPAVTGPSAAHCISWTKTGLTISGGWNLSSIAQDGYTWYKHTEARGVSTYYGMNLSANSSVSRINMVECSYGFNVASGNSITYCTVSGINVYGFGLSGSCTVTNCMGIASGYGSYPAFNIAATTAVVTNCSGISGNAAGGAFTLGASCTVTSCSAYVSVNGFVMSGGSSRAVSCVAAYCSTGFFMYMNNKLWGCTATGCTNYGAATSTTQMGQILENCTFSANAYGIYLTQSFGTLITGCVFTGNTYDVYQDQYCCNTVSVGCSHTTPSTLAYHRAALGGVVTIIGASIDGPSISKIFQQVSATQFLFPQYAVQNSFDGRYGVYFPTYQMIRDTSTSPASVQVQFVSTSSVNIADVKVGTCYAKQSVAKTVFFRLKAASAGWSGTIVPKVKLNGAVVHTGASITSISDSSWTDYTYNIGAGSITSDGELSLDFNPNCNTIAFNLKDFGVTDT